MINVFTATTIEIDNVESAVSSIQSSLEEQGEIGTNALGLITCHYEFVMSGVVEALRKVLPFPIAGYTSSTVATSPVPKGQPLSEAEGDLCLTLTVLWGEGIWFETATTEPVAIDKDIASLCRPIFAGREKPALVWTFAPNVGIVSGDLLTSAVTEQTDGAPVFGGFAVDDSPTFTENCFVITPDGEFLDRVGFVLLYGDVHPLFYKASISEKRIFDRWFMITEANGNEVISINDRSSLDFLALIGITKEMVKSAVLTNIVLAIQEDDLSYFPRQIINLSEHDTLILGGTVENGTRFRVGGFDKLDMLESAQQATQNAFEHSHEKAFALALSCASRFVLLGSESLDEVHMVREAMAGMPFMMGYAGGEICPSVRKDGSFYNRFQNGAFVLCVI
ncbi:MAG: FIST C-terminal domain-containing protein [Lachnospiraceae bacterium]|jgi:hypothetical protein|nr:FIST C-terminal domain-containing protein [Lachnospiraceae bacterium]